MASVSEFQSRRLTAYMAHAEAFVNAKGRPPSSIQEFFNWLVEYEVLVGDALSRLLEAHAEHLKTCNRPVLLANVQPHGASHEEVEDAATGEK